MSAETPRLAIRTEGSASLGLGHLYRCASLAKAWSALGGEARFLVSDRSVEGARAALADAYPTETLNVEVGSRKDSSETLARARGATALAVDGYGFGESFLASVCSKHGNVLRIDDLGGTMPPGLASLLNQNLHASEAIYPGLKSETRRLFGPRFALLRPGFERPLTTNPGTVPPSVAVMLGGTDPAGKIELVARAICRAGARPVVLTSPANPALEKLETAFASLSPKPELLVGARSVDRILDRVDAAVAASGTTTWELAARGVPCALFWVAPNQEPLSRAMAKRGLAQDLGPAQTLSEHAVKQAVSQLVASSLDRPRLRKNLRGLVDGMGARRVCEALMETGVNA